MLVWFMNRTHIQGYALTPMEQLRDQSLFKGNVIRDKTIRISSVTWLSGPSREEGQISVGPWVSYLCEIQLEIFSDRFAFENILVIFLGYIGPERVKSKTMYTTCRFLFFKIMVPSGRFRLFCLQPHCLFTSYTSKPQEVVFCSKIFGWGSGWVFLFTGSTSLDGPGSLVHLGSLKCIHPQGGGDNVGEGTKLLIYGGCSESR